MIAHSAPTIGPEEIESAARVLRSAQLAQGKEVAAFEAECAEALGRRYAVATNCGTSALHLALSALGVTDGERVAIPSYGCAALCCAVRLQRAQPVLCDNGEDLNLDTATIPEGCKAVIVPHSFGAPARLPADHTVVEDIAQSVGGPTGRVAPIAIVSFYATKLMTTGEGGMLLTDQESFAEHARDLRDYDNRDDDTLRYNYKMTDFQAAMGRVQLRRLPDFIRRRRAIAARYGEAFRALPLRLPRSEGHVFFRYVVGTEQREALQAYLYERGIEAKRPVHRPMHHVLGGVFPGAQQAHDGSLSLPIYPSLIEADVDHVIESVSRYFG